MVSRLHSGPKETTWSTPWSLWRIYKGRLAVQKIQRHFSRTLDDQAHEQSNRVVKRSGEAIGIFDSPISLAKWMITGPEIARMLSSLDETLNDYGKSTELYSHHEKTTSLENMFEKVGNSFLEDRNAIHMLRNKSANKYVYEARTLGAEQYSSYEERDFVLGSKSINETIKHNTLSLN